MKSTYVFLNLKKKWKFPHQSAFLFLNLGITFLSSLYENYWNCADVANKTNLSRKENKCLDSLFAQYTDECPITSSIRIELDRLTIRFLVSKFFFTFMYENIFSFCIKTPTKHLHIYMKRYVYYVTNCYTFMKNTCIRTSTQICTNIHADTGMKQNLEWKTKNVQTFVDYNILKFHDENDENNILIFFLERECGTEWVDYVVLVCWSSIRLICLLMKLTLFFKVFFFVWMRCM